jgi:hypothetical protein
MSLFDTFTSATKAGADLLTEAGKTYENVTKIFTPGPTPEPVQPAAPAPVEKTTFSSDPGAMDKLADSFGVPRDAIKWGFFALVALVVAVILSRALGRK